MGVFSVAIVHHPIHVHGTTCYVFFTFICITRENHHPRRLVVVAAVLLFVIKWVCLYYLCINVLFHLFI